MKAIFFGTDGIRGKVGESPINPSCFKALGLASARWLNESQKPLRAVIGWDTRESSPELANAFADGFLCLEGAEIVFLGILPTPATALYIARKNFPMGVSITASHNPYTDNGLKLFKTGGLKLLREEEQQIERIVGTLCGNLRAKPYERHCMSINGARYYQEIMLAAYGSLQLKGKKIVLDTANGATTDSASLIFKSLGAEVVHLGSEPDGRNINRACGSEHPELLEQAVLREKAWLGFAYDGDGDRIIVVDETGHRIDGDGLLGLLAIERKRRNFLSNDCVVVTHQSNSGLDTSLASEGIRVVRTEVGDREVSYAMLQHGASLGGESSGHVILREHILTGDGLCVALEVAKLALERPLSELKKAIQLRPKAEKSLKVNVKLPLKDLKTMNSEAEAIQSPNGRVLIRYSGTEGKLRFLVESETFEMGERCLERLVLAAQKDFKRAGVECY